MFIEDFNLFVMTNLSLDLLVSIGVVVGLKLLLVTVSFALAQHKTISGTTFI